MAVMNTLIRKNIRVLHKESYTLKFHGLKWYLYIKSFSLSALTTIFPPWGKKKGTKIKPTLSHRKCLEPKSVAQARSFQRWSDNIYRKLIQVHYIHLILHLKSAHVRLSSNSHRSKIKDPGLLRKALWSNTVIESRIFIFYLNFHMLQGRCLCYQYRFSTLH